MKKTLNINIKGIIFHLDEDAYNKLNTYLEEIKTHFRNKKGQEEIINDIENRIVELFQQKLNDKKQVIVIEDVEEVIRIMGHPADFDEDSEDDRAFYLSGKGKKRLFRNIDDRMLGGVCSGLGAYFNIDPTIVRIIFLLALFLAGGSILVYVVLWIVIPPARSVSEKLEMQGDPVTISNIEKAFKEEMNEIKDKLDDLTEHAKQTFKKKK
ncbi:MAG: PspC domain-containing protein [Bacteroidetes bacterium]|nr:PspC domain-containing protein [Bacteroidota bacterium]